jgi:hypothetical protein
MRKDKISLLSLFNKEGRQYPKRNSLQESRLKRDLNSASPFHHYSGVRSRGVRNTLP